MFVEKKNFEIKNKELFDTSNEKMKKKEDIPVEIIQDKISLFNEIDQIIMD
jgi:hypothetical protein